MPSASRSGRIRESSGDEGGICACRKWEGFEGVWRWLFREGGLLLLLLLLLLPVGLGGPELSLEPGLEAMLGSVCAGISNVYFLAI